MLTPYYSKMIPLEIKAHSPRLGFEMANSSRLSTGQSFPAPGGITLTYQGTLAYRAVGIPEVLQFFVDASINLELGLFGAWLYDKVKNNHVERIIINRRVVTEITPDAIRQVLEEEIRR